MEPAIYRQRWHKLRESKVDPKQKNSKVQRAIDLLEQAREKYEGFVEQYPAKERLVDGSLQDVNSMIFFAYRQKTVK